MSRKQAKKRSAAVLFETLKLESSIDNETGNLRKTMNDSSTQTDVEGMSPAEQNIDAKLNKVLVLLAHTNAKLDAIGSASSTHCKREIGSVTIRKIDLDPVRSLADLEALEENCKREEFVKATVASIGQLHGRQRYTSRGGTVCLQIIDYFFDRQFLVQCSWTGTGRKIGENEQIARKIPFSRYNRVIDLFHQCVLHSDPEFPLDECKDFLHRCLRNAKQRLEELGGTRKPAARKRKRLQEVNGQDAEYLENPEQEGEVTETVWTMEIAAAEI